MGLDIGDRHSTLFTGLSGFWQRFFRDTQDLEAFYQASEIYLGQVYLDLLGTVLNIGVVDTPVFNKEYWRLFLIDETQVDFREGASVAEDRFWYDMPGTEVTTDFLQNTIFDPDVLFERGVDFDVENNDGYVRFYTDPFRGIQNTDGEWLPRPGIGWRTIQKQVGNQFTDQERNANWTDDSDVKRGDTLRLLASSGALVQSGVGGSITVGSPNIFHGPPAFDETLCQEGDIIIVYGSVVPDEDFDGVYIIGRWRALDQVDLESTFYVPSFSSTTPLQWRHYRAVYQLPDVADGVVKIPFRDFEVDYFDKKTIIGSPGNPYPLDVVAPVVYSVVRDVVNNTVWGAAIQPFPFETDFGFRHIIPGSVKVYARVLVPTVHQAIEGVDYTIDYLHGRLHQLVPFDNTGVMTCDYQYQREVLYSAGGAFSPKDVGRVKQLSLWVPETLVDRFTLYYNYGSLLNRFAASSEAYKAFLRGIMHLYVSGPILERIESALNLAAGYPLIKSDGEILDGYDNGEIYTANDGTITALTRYFYSPSYVFSELDVGGQIIFPNPLNDFNKGHFRVLHVVDPHTVELESSYGFIDEGPAMEWVLTHTYQKTVTTNLNTYKFPYTAPIRNDVMDITQVGRLTFRAFESLTVGFTVTDYIEDPRWWHGKYIPYILWNESLGRRYATSQLFEHVIGPIDDLRIGDPGFFIGADDEGNVFTPTDGLGPNPVSLYRHCTAFILFDRYMKCHIFYIDIAPDQELPAGFMSDLEELILVSKPSYTYPYVEPNSAFDELATLFDRFLLGVGFEWSDSALLADNYLCIGDADFPWDIGDYYRYIDTSITIPGTAGNPVVPFRLPVTMFVPPVPGPVVLGQRLISATIYATRASDGQPVLEGRDYSIQWNVDEPDAWWVVPLTVWTVPGVDIAADITVVEYDNVSYTPCPFGIPDTRIGFTPLAIGGTNPAYVRRGALNPSSPDYAADWPLVKTRYVDRSLSLHVTVNPTTVPEPYTYP